MRDPKKKFLNRGTIGLVVRLLAVVAAIYTFFSFRNQMATPPAPRGAIPVRVVGPQTCGTLVAEKTETPGEKTDLAHLPDILQAIEKPGQAIPVRDKQECDRYTQMSGVIVSSDSGSYRIKFN